MSYRCQYAWGRDGDWPRTGFSPSKQNLTLYLMSGSEDYDPLPARLGDLKIGKSCLYIDKLADVDLFTLRLLVRTSAADMAPACPVS